MSVVLLAPRHDGAGAPSFNVLVIEHISGTAKVSNWIATLDDPITRWDDPRVDSGNTQRAHRGEIPQEILSFTGQATYKLALTDEELDVLCKTVLVKSDCANRADRPRVVNGSYAADWARKWSLWGFRADPLPPEYS